MNFTEFLLFKAANDAHARLKLVIEVQKILYNFMNIYLSCGICLLITQYIKHTKKMGISFILDMTLLMTDDDQVIIS